MKRIIHKIRLQPPEFRIMVAVIGAVIMTGIIGLFWSMSISTGTFQTEKSDATPGPLTSLISNIKNVIHTESEENPVPFSGGNTVQVIDAGVQSDYDESNPASASATTTQ